MAEFGRLEPVDLRAAWKREALNFTLWLAENLDRLSQAVGIEMNLEDTEVQIDRFSSDILARNAHDYNLVLIENQLEWSDHTHPHLPSGASSAERDLDRQRRSRKRTSPPCAG